MSFSGSVDKLMVDSGLSDILKHTFGKKFPRLQKHMGGVETLRSWMQC